MSGFGDSRGVSVTSLGPPIRPASDWEEKGNEEGAKRDDQVEDMPSSSSTWTDTNIGEGLVITSVFHSLSSLQTLLITS